MIELTLEQAKALALANDPSAFPHGSVSGSGLVPEVGPLRGLSIAMVSRLLPSQRF